VPPEDTSTWFGSSETYRVQALRQPSSVRGKVSAGAPPGDCRSQMPKESASYPRTYRNPEWLYRMLCGEPGKADGVAAGPAALWDAAGVCVARAVGVAEAPGAAALAVCGRCCMAVSTSMRRSLKQYRHLMASSWISSAQYGHFFTLVPSGRGARLPGNDEDRAFEARSSWIDDP